MSDCEVRQPTIRVHEFDANLGMLKADISLEDSKDDAQHGLPAPGAAVTVEHLAVDIVLEL